ncbi:PREDICTED: caldesmon [Gekko japonicus]|uniref:Caldesmon n=1 Tax=Gekko japonicus TaxID=146911 RepID=A0ABM1KP23_GEKJA|nr:PREDICTED: caldesmon [Gekko japonicus]
MGTEKRLDFPASRQQRGNLSRVPWPGAFLQAPWGVRYLTRLFLPVRSLIPRRLAYQRNDDDDEEAARERRRRARQERLRQREEDDVSGTEKPEVNDQNNIGDEESQGSTKTVTTVTNTQGDGEGDEAVFLERMARREERRQKRLQEALERQKEFDPTVTDESLSFTSRREVNNVEENEAPGKEDKVETHRGRYEIEETETITRSYQRNNLRRDEEDEKKEEADEEEAQEEKPKQRTVEENQVEATIEKKTLDKEEEAVVLDIKLPEVNADEQKVANDTSAVAEEQIESEEAISITVALDGKKDEEDEAEKKRTEEKERLEREEERERQKAEEERKRLEEEEKRAAEEKERLEAEERERLKAEERRKAEEERKRVEAEEKRAAEEKKRREAEERERIKAEEKKAAEERERAKEKERKAAEAKRAAEEKAKQEEEKLKAKQKAEEKRVDDKLGKGKKGEEKKIEEKQVKEKKVQEEKTPAASLRKQGEEAKKEKLQEEKLRPAFKKEEIKDSKVSKDKAPKDEVKPSWDRKKGIPESKPQNGERFPELPAHKLKHTENAFSCKTGNKQPLYYGLRIHRELSIPIARRKILEEEEQRRKKEEADRKTREEEEKRRLKEEIERRRAEAAEKRQKIPEEGLSEDKKPFKCFTPKGSSLKIEERAEFLNKSAQKSGSKPTPTAVVSKIDSRLEQYTSAIEGTKAARPVKAAPSDLPVPAEGVRNIKSMWEKGNVFSSPSGTGTPNKETAGLKVGVSSRINEWLTKTPENNKSPAPKPSDLRPGDVSGKRNLWEKQSVEKASSPTKVTAAGKKSETNGLRQFEKEP